MVSKNANQHKLTNFRNLWCRQTGPHKKQEAQLAPGAPPLQAPGAPPSPLFLRVVVTPLPLVPSLHTRRRISSLAHHTERLLAPAFRKNALRHHIPGSLASLTPPHSPPPTPPPPQALPSPSPLTIRRADPKDVDGPITEGHNQVPAIHHGGHPGLFQAVIGRQEVTEQ